jgi:hypothetical protein
MTGHGGKRGGAGRKKAYNEMELLVLGAECERMWREAEKERIEALIQAYLMGMPDFSEAEMKLKELNSLSTEYKIDWVKKGCKNDFSNYSNLEKIDSDFQYQDDSFIYENDENPAFICMTDRLFGLQELKSRGQRIKIHRRYGDSIKIREDIIRTVSQHAENLITRHCSVASVREAWGEFRQIQKRIDAESQGFASD